MGRPFSVPTVAPASRSARQSAMFAVTASM